MTSKSLYKNYISLKNGSKKNSYPEDFNLISNFIIKHISKCKKEKIKVLEIGCGEGNLMKYLSKRFKLNLKGIDISTKQVNKAKEKCLEVINTDIFQYVDTIEDEKIDLIILIDVLEHLPKEKLENLFMKLAKNLNENGFIIFKFPNGYCPLSSIYFVADATHQWLPSITSLEQLLVKSGLRLYDKKPLYIKIKSISSFVRYFILIGFDYFFRVTYFIINGPSYLKTICTPNVFVVFKKK